MDERCYAPATQRNREPILAVLRRVLPASGSVLEIASGTGEHAVWLAAKLPGIVIQPSDPDPENCASIAAWAGFTGVPNVRPPLAIDVTAQAWDAGEGVPPEPAAILCINVIHISPWAATLGLMRGRARCSRRAACSTSTAPTSAAARTPRRATPRSTRACARATPIGACAIWRR